MHLAPYACNSKASRGRVHDEADDPRRNPFQRDRDRIIHCTAFRRLEYKTQVFVNHEGDLFRTRLTHSLEVAQIGRAIARNLQLNEDLTEAICLAHDLGHTPFGHAGQDALHKYLQTHYPDLTGFEHNLQSLRVVDKLEQRYARFDGLNLCFETRQGILKHCSKCNARELGEVAEHFLNKTRPSLEAQLANLADEIAYNNHDIDDGLRSGLLKINQLREVEIFEKYYREVEALYPDVRGKRQTNEIIRRMINDLIGDVTEQSLRNLKENNVSSYEEVSAAPVIVAFSPEMRRMQDELKGLLMAKLYRHPNVMQMSFRATHIINQLFDAYRQEPKLLADDFRYDEPNRQARAISDYIAGMTDRYAIKRHRQMYNLG